ncbi:hypothetical protein CEY16_06255 [Halalkalibacillus sediminis]|uniref:Uncharacterized protein n=1 Tax=Halalkalibacillus sediminis TaxID=2018042 RepID=A0A2I0QYC9_9BACI|nr:hypothetical protein [Halalkalibacillus sediminis]PKR79341.1 hypothetical protein CEY16_06255 [Halalkalibacillus sediminis]
MKNFLKLTNFEFNRFSKLLGGLLLFVFAMQMLGTFMKSREYLSRKDEMMINGGATAQDFILSEGTMSFQRISQSLWFNAPILICVAAVLFYIFFIWYREWFGKNTFVYRLMTLPTSRMNIFFSKMMTILIITWTFIVAQIGFILVGKWFMTLLIPREFISERTLSSIINSNAELMIIYPATLTEWFLIYGLGITVVSVLFTVVLFERCLRIKGAIVGVIYSALALLIMLLPIILQDLVLDGYFYTSEILMLLILAGVIVFSLSAVTSSFLLNRKIRV